MSTLRRVGRVPAARAALLVLALVALCAVAGSALAPHDPLAQHPAAFLRGPDTGHLLGTDYLGRDVLSRLLAGTGLSVAGALEAVGAAMVLGVLPGVASVWCSRSVEWGLLRAADTLMIMPFAVFAIAVVGALGNGLHQAMLALGVLYAPLYFRVTRAATLGLARAQYVEAAELMGASRWWILRVHVLGKVLPTVAVTTAQAMGQALLVVSSLTFLGLGVQPPAPTWGGMLASDLGFLAQQPWAPLVPGAAIMVTVGALNLLADGVRDSAGVDAPGFPRRSGRRRRRRGDAVGKTPAEHVPGEAGAVRGGSAPALPRPPDVPAPAGSPDEGPPAAPTAPAPVLSVDGLHVTVGHGRHRAVRDVSFTLGRGEAVGLVGESGSGKSLTCRSVLGVLPPGCEVDRGGIALDGAGAGGGRVDLTALGRAEWDEVRGRRLGAVFQDPASYLNPSLTVGHQVAEQLRVALGLSRTAAHARSVELLTAVGLHRAAEVHHQYPHELSGGMLQRVLIAVAVSCSPELVIADEATTALDVVVQAEILALLRRLRAEQGLALLLVTHDLAVVAETCDRVLVMYAGEIVEEGPTAQVLDAPAHPYTQALLRVAAGAESGDDLETIPGRPPEAGAELPGCRFAERCAYATDACLNGPVAPRTVGEGRRARCLHPVGPRPSAAGAAPEGVPA